MPYISRLFAGGGAEFRSLGIRKDLVGAIARQTPEYCRGAGAAYSDAEFHRLLAEYPDIVSDYRIVSSGGQSAK